MAKLLIIIIIFAFSIPVSASTRSDNFSLMYTKFRKTDSRTLYKLGRNCISRHNTDSAMAIFTILANRYDSDAVDKVDKKYAIEARLSLGVLNFLRANYAAAYSNFLTASQLEGKDDSPGNMNLASIYLYYGDKPRAYRCLKRVFDSAVRSGNNYMASAAIINILTCNKDTAVIPDDTVRSIITTYRQKVPRTAENKAWPLAHCYSEAKIYSLDKHDDMAINMLRASLDSAKSMLLPEREYYASYIALGNKYLDIGEPDSAEYFLRKAEDIAQSNSYTELLVNAYSELSKLYAVTGRNDLASEYRFKHLSLHDSIFSAKEYGNIHDLELFYETDKFEKQINRIQMEEKMRTKIITVIVIALLILAAMLAILYLQNRKLRRKNKSLFERNLEIMISENATATKDKKQPNPMPDLETRNRISESIRKAMSDEKVFCSEGFSMRELSELCGSNQKYVSQVLNKDYGKTFTQLLNERRINIARRRLMDFNNYGHLTIEAIVADLGFKSRSTFSKTFKNLTGLTPSEFQRIAQEEQYNKPDTDAEE